MARSHDRTSNQSVATTQVGGVSIQNQKVTGGQRSVDPDHTINQKVTNHTLITKHSACDWSLRVNWPLWLLRVHV